MENYLRNFFDFLIFNNKILLLLKIFAKLRKINIIKEIWKLIIYYIYIQILW
jgi:hypothetical protein